MRGKKASLGWGSNLLGRVLAQHAGPWFHPLPCISQAWWCTPEFQHSGGGDRRIRSSGSSLTLCSKFSNLDYTRPYLKQRLRPSKRVTGSKFIPSSLTASLVPGPHVLQGECWLLLSPLTSHVFCRVSGTTHTDMHTMHTNILKVAFLKKKKNKTT